MPVGSALGVVATGQPGLAGAAPAVLADRLRDLLAVRVHQAVRVEEAVEVVVLVLEDPREPAVRLDLERFAVLVLRTEQGALGAAEGEAFAGYREAALGLLVLVEFLHRLGDRGSDPQDRVHRDAAVHDLGIIGP